MPTLHGPTMCTKSAERPPFRADSDLMPRLGTTTCCCKRVAAMARTHGRLRARLVSNAPEMRFILMHCDGRRRHNNPMQVGLVDMLKEEYGIEPAGMLGHSAGEIACGYADGCLTREQTVLIAYHRGASCHAPMTSSQPPAAAWTPCGNASCSMPAFPTSSKHRGCLALASSLACCIRSIQSLEGL